MPDPRLEQIDHFIDCLLEGQPTPALALDGENLITDIANKLERLALLRETTSADIALFARGPVVVFRWRNEEGWPVEFVSQNVERLTGYPIEEFASGRLPYASLIDAEDIERVGQEVADNAASSAWFEHEPYRIHRQDGEVLWVYDYTVVLRDGEGTATHFYGYIMDISDRRERDEQIEEQLRVIDSLGAPLVQVWDGVLTVPLVGLLSEARAAAMTEALLERVASTSTHTIIIDLTGTEDIDTSTVLHLHRASKAVSLLGCDCLLSGVSASMAQTMVSLGVEFSDVGVHRTLAAALRSVLARI